MNDSDLIREVRRNAENISSASGFVTIMTNDYLNDPYCAMQLGLAVLLDKPIYCLVKSDVHVPDNIKKIAVKILVFDDESNISEVAKNLWN